MRIPLLFRTVRGINSAESYLGGGLIRIYVGPKKKIYDIHLKLLSACSTWFKRCIEDGLFWIFRNSSPEMYMEDQDPAVFELFIDWLYRKSLKPISTDSEDEAEEQAAKYIDLYLNAATWNISDLQNDVIACLKARSDYDCDWFSTEIIDKVYSHPESVSAVRSIIVHSFLTKCKVWDAQFIIRDVREVLEEHLDEGNKHFVLDCYEALFDLCRKGEIG